MQLALLEGCIVEFRKEEYKTPWLNWSGKMVFKLIGLIERQLFEKRYVRNFIFIVLQKACDSIPVTRLFKILRRRGMNPIYV